MKRRLFVVISYGFARVLMTFVSILQIVIWIILAIPSLFSRKVALFMSDMVLFQPDPDAPDETLFMTKPMDWPCVDEDTKKEE
jgi:hypothetical protein